MSCDDSDDAAAPQIEGNALEVVSGRGTTANVSFNATAEAGIASLLVSVDDAPAVPIDVEEGAKEANIEYDFTIPAHSTVGTEFSLVFTLTDRSDEQTTINATVTTGRLIETPQSYTFMRDGVSTVEFPGQTDRLDMLEELKDFLKTADKGAAISEQALLDMFANTNGNGGGHFSFNSNRQLKDKVFAPDLDSRLFEGFFAAAAQASVAGSNGVEAANGTAGLMVRENGGRTVLVDAKGREFTQLIEKGLMGAVFINQIFNTYLTDNRIGPGIENVNLREGKNHTDKEHHLDEAYGYWDAPVDFTSSWPESRKDEDRFWSHYSDVVDNVANGLLGTNSTIQQAYIEARTAIVNNDLIVLDEQRQILYENLELVAAATAVHYINLTLRFLNEGNTGEAFHVLSEAWAFTNALRYNPKRKISLEQVDQILSSDFGADRNFWNVTPTGLNAAKTTLVGLYPQLEPVKDDL